MRDYFYSVLYMRDYFYSVLYSRENVYNRQPKMQARFNFFSKEFSFENVDKKAFNPNTKEGKINLEILSNAYLAKQEDLEGIKGYGIASFFQQEDLEGIKGDDIASFFQQVANKKDYQKDDKEKVNDQDELIIAEEFYLKTTVDYQLRLSKNIPQDCIGVVVVAVGAHNTLLGAKKHYRELIDWNKKNPEKKMGMIFFDYRGAGLSDDIKPEDLNSDQAIIDDVKEVIKYAADLKKPICLSGTCFGTGPLTGAICQLSQECESDEEFNNKYQLKGILRSLEYSTFASVAKKQRDYLGSFWHCVVATFGAPYRSATLTSLSNSHETAYIPKDIPVSTFQATRPRWTSSEPLSCDSKSFYVSDAAGFFGSIVESFFQNMLLRAGDAMMGLEQAYKNWGIKHNPGRFIIDPTISHSEGVGFTEVKLACLADMFDYNCGQNKDYKGLIRKPSEIELEVLRPFLNDQEYHNKIELLDYFSLYPELVQQCNQKSPTNDTSDDVQKNVIKAFLEQSNLLRNCLNKLPQEYKEEILKKLNCQEVFEDKNRLFDLQTFESLVKELEEYQKHFGKCLRKIYVEEAQKKLREDFTQEHPFFGEVAKEFEKTDEQDLWYKIYQAKETDKNVMTDFTGELKSRFGKEGFEDWLNQKAQEIGIENQNVGDLLSNVNKISEQLKKISLEASTKGMEYEFYERQKDIKSLKVFWQCLQPNNIAEFKSKSTRDFDLTKPNEIKRIETETKQGIKYYRELYQLKAILNPEKYVLEQDLANFREKKKNPQSFYQEILNQNIAYAIAGYYIAKNTELDNKLDSNNLKEEFSKMFDCNITDIDVAKVIKAYQKLQELQSQALIQKEVDKKYLTSSQGNLSPTGVWHKVDYGKFTPEEAFLQKVKDVDYMKRKIKKWNEKLISATPSCKAEISSGIAVVLSGYKDVIGI